MGDGLTALLSQFSAAMSLHLEQGATMLTERLGLSTRSISQTLQSEVNSLRSEMRGEFAAIRREEQRAARALLEEVKAQRQALAEERQQFADSKKLASERKWLVMLGNGRHICVHCDRHYHLLGGQDCGRFLDSPWLQRNGGVKYNDGFQKQARTHENSKMHSICVSLEEERDAEPLRHAFKLAEHDADEVTARVFKIVLDSLKHYRSFLEHEALCFLQTQNDTNLGDRLHGRKTAATMLETIYAEQSDQAALFLSTPNEYTRRLPYVGTAADKVCDSKFASWEIVNGRVNYHGTPVSFIMELREITSDSADGDTCLAEIDGASERLKIKPSQRLTYCFDGEACYQGGSPHPHPHLCTHLCQ